MHQCKWGLAIKLSQLQAANKTQGMETGIWWPAVQALFKKTADFKSLPDETKYAGGII